MLYVISYSSPQLEWRISSGVPLYSACLREIDWQKDNAATVLCAVKEVHADGEELALIRENLRGLRDAPHKSFVMFASDDAQFIVMNL